MASPLGIEKRIKDTGKPRSFQFFTNDHHNFRKFHHWTLEVGELCYELVVSDSKKNSLTFANPTDFCAPSASNASDWLELRTSHGIEPEKWKVGQTKMTPEVIWAEGKRHCVCCLRYVSSQAAHIKGLILMAFSAVEKIWRDFNHGQYWLFTGNCQNFVKMLYQRIAVPKDDPSVSDIEKTQWEKIPGPISYKFAEGSQGSLAGSAGYGIRAAYLAALANVTEAAEEGGLVAATATAGSIEEAGVATTLSGAGAVDVATKSGGAAVSVTTGSGASGGVVAAGGSAVGGTTVGGTAAGGTAVGSTAVGGSAATSTATATTAEGAGASGATHTAAGAMGTTKGAAGGSAAAGKTGIGIKAAGLGHAAAHGAVTAKVATIGAGMTKVGGGAMLAHPLAGAAILGAGAGLTYFATKGKSSKRWSKKHPPAPDLGDELSISDVLGMEAEVLDHAQDVEQSTDGELRTKLESANKVDDELAEGLKTASIGTEPPIVLDQRLDIDGAIPADTVSAKLQTVS